MAIIMKCSCGSQVRVKDELLGKKVRCPSCSSLVVVGSGEHSPLPPVPVAPTSGEEPRGEQQPGHAPVPQYPAGPIMQPGPYAVPSGFQPVMFGPAPMGLPKGTAVAAMVLGICALVLCHPLVTIPCGILAVIFGVVAKKRVKVGTGAGGGMATAGLACGLSGVVVWTALFFVGFAMFAARPASASAKVTLHDGSIVSVHDIKLKETAEGIWIGARPTNLVSEMYYTVENSGATLTHAVPFADISTIEFRSGGKPTDSYRPLQWYKISLKKGGSVEWDSAKKSLILTGKDLKQDTHSYISYHGSGIQSGKVVQGQRFSGEGFVGRAVIGSQRAEWSATLGAVKQVDFVGDQ